MHRFYYPDTDFTCDQITLTDKGEIHHLQNVLRLKKGNEIIIFNGKNKETQGIIVSMNSKEVVVKILSTRENKIHLPHIILACAIPKKTKFEFILEKATELGVSEIIPLKTERTEFRLAGERLIGKQKRFETVVINAAKQCRRSTIPKIHPITKFDDALIGLTQTAHVLFPCLSGNRKPILKALQDCDSSKPIAIMIGPEGDFTEQEYAAAQKKGCTLITLGDTILKVETAALCTLACVAQFYQNSKH